ncbi:hypothetical protein BC332_18250 [Capsicum chinense]|nr:hypothetical protein BC332_18250 [Capsicum chinense]
MSCRYKLFLKVTDLAESDFITLLLWDQQAVKLIGKTVTELVNGLHENVGVSSYPLELDNILDREVMFKVTIKKDNIEQHDEVYTVLKFSDDKDLIKQYCPYPSEETCTDPVAEKEVNSASNTPVKRSRSESESSVVDIDEDPTAQLSSSKRKRVIKKE